MSLELALQFCTTILLLLIGFLLNDFRARLSRLEDYFMKGDRHTRAQAYLHEQEI